MFRHRILFLLTSVAIASSAMPVRAADQAGAAEVKLRESLRATTLQLRNAEAERATLQAAQADLDAKNKMLTEQLEKLTKQTAANQADADRAIAELKGKVDERDREIGTLRVSLDKWKAEHQKVTDYAKAKDAQVAKLGERVIVLDRQVADQQRRNVAMYKLGTEILARYEGFGLGTALTSREPFVGITRVKFENLIQDYGDKLADERIKTPPSHSAAQHGDGAAAQRAATSPTSPKTPSSPQPSAGKPKPAQ